MSMSKKRNLLDSPGGSPRKIPKSHSTLTPTATPPLVNQKLAELGKLRQQHMEGVNELIDSLESVKKEFAEEDSIIDLQQELKNTDKMCDIMTHESLKMYEREIKYSESIGSKEEKSNTLSTRFTELWECQKIVCNYMEDITELLRICEHNINKVTELYEEVTVKQSADSLLLDDQLQNIIQYNNIEKELEDIKETYEQETDIFKKLKHENEQFDQELRQHEIHKRRKEIEVQEMDKKLNEFISGQQMAKKSQIEERNKNMKEIEDILLKQHSFVKQIEEKENKLLLFQDEINDIKKQQLLIYEDMTKIKSDIKNVQDETKKLEENVEMENLNKIQIQNIQDKIKNCIAEKKATEEKYIQVQTILTSKKIDFISKIENCNGSEDLESTKEKLKIETDKSAKNSDKNKTESNQQEIQIKSARKLLEIKQLNVKDHDDKLKNLELETKYKCKELEEKIHALQLKLKDIEEEKKQLRKKQGHLSGDKTSHLKQLNVEGSTNFKDELENPKENVLLSQPFIRKMETFNISSDEDIQLSKEDSCNEEDKLIDKTIRRLSQSSQSLKQCSPINSPSSNHSYKVSTSKTKKFFTSRKSLDGDKLNRNCGKGRGSVRGRENRLCN